MHYRIPTALAAFLVLSACGSKEAPTGDGSSAAASIETTAAATPAAASADGAGALTKEYIVGKWGEDGDCTLAIDYRADGTTDGPFGNWSLEGNVLSMADNPQKMHLTVIDKDTMESRLDGKAAPDKLTRCK